jgi:hypothetical protein
MSDLWPSSPGDVVRPSGDKAMPAILCDLLRAPSSGRTNYRLVTLGIVALLPLCCFGQQKLDEEDQKPAGHVLWVIPNFRTSPELQEYKPIAPSEKFRLAAQDTFDRGTIALAAAFAGESQFSRSNPSFGGGAQAYAHYWIAAYNDFAIGNYMTEAIFPTLLDQDPRYFRRGSGGGLSRLGSAVGQIFWTYTDSGGRQFNYSEIAGNSTAVAISMAYYPGNRNASNAAGQLGTQVAVDMPVNIVKEFWPSRERKASRKSGAVTR